jgi:hypothetical protein
LLSAGGERHGADLGGDGKRGLQQALAGGLDVMTRSVIEAARRPILDYPSSHHERQRIRGRRPFAGRA